MEDFKENYRSLVSQLDDDINLSAVLDFITYFRCDDIGLYQEFIKDYQDVGYYNANKLIELYCKKNNILLNDENASRIFNGLVQNIWNDNMSYHLTTSVSALNIYENGMDPSKKEMDVLEDINSLSSLLSEENRNNFFPFVMGDIKKYSYSTIPRLGVNYGRKPEWYLNLILYSNGSLEEILDAVLPEISDESDLAKEKMVEVISKYHDLYENSSRTMVVIPGLNNRLSSEVIDSFGVNSIDSLKSGISRFLTIRGHGIDSKTDKVVSSDNLMFIDVKSKKMIDFSTVNKTM